jgi:hypothetical protein
MNLKPLQSSIIWSIISISVSLDTFFLPGDDAVNRSL